MARGDKEEQARREGMAYALKVAKEKGIEGLEEEIKFRGISKVPIAVSRAAMEEGLTNIKSQTIDSVCLLSAVTLHDEFGFGHKRLQQFIDRFNLKAECLMDGYTNWIENLTILEQECAIRLNIRMGKQVLSKDGARVKGL